MDNGEVDIKAPLRICEEFARAHLGTCAAELLAWRSTGRLGDGKLRELAALCASWSGRRNALNAAEHMVATEALRQAQQRPIHGLAQQPDAAGSVCPDAAPMQEAHQPAQPDPGLINSMALRYRHDFGLLDAAQQESIRATMHQLWEEVVGLGLYRPAADAAQPPCLATRSAAEIDLRRRLAVQLRRAGASLPAPQPKGTPESGILTGLSIALAIIDNEPEPDLEHRLHSVSGPSAGVRTALLAAAL